MHTIFRVFSIQFLINRFVVYWKYKYTVLRPFSASRRIYFWLIFFVATPFWIWTSFLTSFHLSNFWVGDMISLQAFQKCFNTSTIKSSILLAEYARDSRNKATLWWMLDPKSNRKNILWRQWKRNCAFDIGNFDES